MKIKTMAVLLGSLLFCSHATAEELQNPENEQKQDNAEQPEKSKETDSQDIKQNTPPAVTVTEEIPYDEYINNQNDLKRKYLRENWRKHPNAKEVNGITYLEFEGKKKRTSGHLFMIPSWGDMAKLVPLAKIAAEKNFDTFIFFPVPELNEQIPYSEEKNAINQESRYLEYIGTAISTIGSHERSNLILLDGNTAGWLIDKITNNELLKADAIILLDVFYKDQNANAVLADYFAGFKGFTLDLLTKESNNRLNEAFSKRKFLCEKEGKPPMLTKSFKSDDREEMERYFSNYLKKTDFTLLPPRKKEGRKNSASK